MSFLNIVIHKNEIPIISNEITNICGFTNTTFFEIVTFYYISIDKDEIYSVAELAVDDFIENIPIGVNEYNSIYSEIVETFIKMWDFLDIKIGNYCDGLQDNNHVDFIETVSNNVSFYVIKIHYEMKKFNNVYKFKL